mmetsp:Transcript_19746/g.20024  ORF Transcript_19746/g.20024 Transcript_19746/m.20024 type:complete len:141 (+) Transcript_19746:105-527(+)
MYVRVRDTIYHTINCHYYVSFSLSCKHYTFDLRRKKPLNLPTPDDFFFCSCSTVSALEKSVVVEIVLFVRVAAVPRASSPPPIIVDVLSFVISLSLFPFNEGEESGHWFVVAAVGVVADIGDEAAGVDELDDDDDVTLFC